MGLVPKWSLQGDRTQIDLPKGVKSGLVRSEEILKNVKDLSFVYLEQSDVVRHPLVARIITAYEQANE